jgi:hypothetical protein
MAGGDAVDLTPMYMSLSKGQSRAFFDAHPEYMRQEVAEAARQDAIQAAHQGHADITFLAASAAATIYLNLGDRTHALINRLDALQALFMLSEDEAAYDDVRKQALELHELAREISSQHVTFRSLVLAADCSWFTTEAATAGQPGNPLEPRTVRTLEDVLMALRAAGPVVDDPDDRIWIERLASILAVSAEAAMSETWNNVRSDADRLEQQLDRLLRQVAVAADVLPVDLRFEGEGPGKTAAVAVVLEELESKYR